jgi:hypothetical protein
MYNAYICELDISIQFFTKIIGCTFVHPCTHIAPPMLYGDKFPMYYVRFIEKNVFCSLALVTLRCSISTIISVALFALSR